jgi:hypothetical protein
MPKSLALTIKIIDCITSNQEKMIINLIIDKFFEIELLHANIIGYQVIISVGAISGY